MTNDDFELLVNRYERLVFTVCYQMVHDYQDAQNLAQDTFLSAYDHRDRCNLDAIKPWLTRIASNKCRDYLKSAYQRKVSLSPPEELPELPGGDIPDDLVSDKESAERIRRHIYSLREPYLMVSKLYFLEEKSIEEIARILNRPRKTVQTQISRARVILQNMIKEDST